MTTRPRIALTVGDPNGVGPEVLAAAWGDPRVHGCCRPIAVGPLGVLKRAVMLRGGSVEVVRFEDPQSAFEASGPGLMPCIDPGGFDSEPEPGKTTAAGGASAYASVCLATAWALGGDCDALVTAPLSKAALHAAGYHYPGHTELLAELCGVPEFAMMLYLPAGQVVAGPYGLGVVHVTLHTALRSVFDQLSPEAIASKCKLADNALRAFGAARPRIAVAALNPHAGEGGLFGDEEATIIAPAVRMAQQAGIDASGPHPVDTLMMRARHGEFDAVVAMYHDQGHIALKLLGMHSAVNVTLGLPIVRSSVAHGTAPDLAWRGLAESKGMVSAIETAALLAGHR